MGKAKQYIHIGSVDLEKVVDNINWKKVFEIRETVETKYRERGII